MNEVKECQNQFIIAAKKALAEYKNTGEHITLEELEAWAKTLGNDPQIAMPECHQ